MNRVSFFLNVIASMFLLLTTAGCTQSSHIMQLHPHVEAHHPWVRAVPANSPTSAAYMVLYNHGDRGEQLMSVSSPIAGTAELHTVMEKDGVMSMRPVKHITIPAHGSQELKPGGSHIMLINLKQTLIIGEEVSLTLNFQHAGTVELKVAVLESQIKGLGHEHSMDHSNHQMEHNN